MISDPPRHGEGDRAQRGGGGAPSVRRPEVESARRLRREMSLPEVLLWQRLRGGKAGAKFRRQHPVGPYVVDFYCREAALVIEIDGEVHGANTRIARDAHRDAFLRENGYEVLHVNALEVLRDADQAAAAIATLVARPLHHPSDGPPPRAGEDQ
ncbi:endonuclease domain-containing protein [Sphingomonas sp. CJ20]